MSVIFIIKCFIIYSSLIYSKNLVETTDTSSPTSPGSGAGGAKESKQASGTPTSGGTTTGANGGTKTGVELSIKATAATDEFEYKKESKIVTYTAKDTYGFKSVKTGDKLIWSTDNASEYGKEVVLNGKGNKKKEVTIHKFDKSKVLCFRDAKDKPWISYDTSKTNPVSINIAYKEDSFKYTNKLEGKVRTFEAKDGFVFNQVRCKEGSNWYDIWKTDNENEYVKKVVNEKNEKVTIHLKDGGTKVFNKESGNKWKEDSSASKKGSGTDNSGTKPASPTSGGTTGTGNPTGTGASAGGGT